MGGVELAKRFRFEKRAPTPLQDGHENHAFVRCNLPHINLRFSGPSLCRGQEAQDMKPSKPIPLWLTIDALIIIVGMGLIALGISVASLRIFGSPA